MGGNVKFSSALQAPVVLSNPTGELAVEGQFQLGGGNAPIAPGTGVLALPPGTPKLGQAKPTFAGAVLVSGTPAQAISGVVTPINPAVGAAVITALAPTVTKSSSGGGSILFPFGHWVEVGGLDSFHGLTDWETNVNIVVNQDPGGAVVGFIAVFDGAGVEGATLGDFTSFFSNVQSMLTFLAGLSGPKRLLGICVNVTGNVGHATAPAYMVNDATYGKVQAGTGYMGGLFDGISPVNGKDTVKTMRFDVPATAARIAAWGQALYNRFGNQVAIFDPLYSEYQNFSTEVAEMTSAAMTATLAGPNGMFDQLRAGMPTTCLLHNPSFINQSDFPTLLNGSDRNFMIPCVFDFTNETIARTGGSFKLVTTNAAFKGGSYSSLPSGSFVPNYPGLFDRRQFQPGGGRGLAAHIGEDELGHSNAPSLAVPPALVGDGCLNTGIWPFVNAMQVGIVIWYKNAAAGPPCNTTAGYTGQPANYPDYSGWGNEIGFLKLNPVPGNSRPPFYA